MSLPVRIKDLNEVDEALQQFYTQDEDGYILDLDDSGYKAKLDEFRQNNRKLMKKQQEYQEQMKQFEGVDPEKYQQALEAWEELEKQKEKDTLEAGDVDKVLEQRTAKMKEQYETQIQKKDQAYKQATEELDKLRGRLGSLVIDSSVQSTISKLASPRPGAMDDILNRARQSFTIDEEGHMQPVTDETGKGYDKDGNLMTLDKWAEELVNDAPFLFESSQGGGSGGGKKGNSEPGQKTVASGDPVAFGKNLADIASGKVRVSPGQ